MAWRLNARRTADYILRVVMSEVRREKLETSTEYGVLVEVPLWEACGVPRGTGTVSVAHCSRFLQECASIGRFAQGFPANYSLRHLLDSRASLPRGMIILFQPCHPRLVRVLDGVRGPRLNLMEIRAHDIGKHVAREAVQGNKPGNGSIMSPCVNSIPETA
ncbi:hypothetical protein EV356DRAFT_497475 [Viridothelium virens]|uniref:Uncharacterized protein n=1 Tax=Viridothelium virens TaxID=1048519 RepID=A0A6A6GSL4_VIRVR|nr:hypothetical protein EV356DRAFT_497475 [Viridothelium virens]